MIDQQFSNFPSSRRSAARSSAKKPQTLLCSMPNCGSDTMVRRFVYLAADFPPSTVYAASAVFLSSCVDSFAEIDILSFISVKRAFGAGLLLLHDRGSSIKDPDQSQHLVLGDLGPMAHAEDECRHFFSRAPKLEHVAEKSSQLPKDGVVDPDYLLMQASIVEVLPWLDLRTVVELFRDAREERFLPEPPLSPQRVGGQQGTGVLPGPLSHAHARKTRIFEQLGKPVLQSSWAFHPHRFHSAIERPPLVLPWSEHKSIADRSPASPYLCLLWPTRPQSVSPKFPISLHPPSFPSDIPPRASTAEAFSSPLRTIRFL